MARAGREKKFEFNKMKLQSQQANTKKDDYSQQINYKNELNKHMKHP